MSSVFCEKVLAARHCAECNCALSQNISTRCSGCEFRTYCNLECQNKHWKTGIWVDWCQRIEEVHIQKCAACDACDIGDQGIATCNNYDPPRASHLKCYECHKGLKEEHSKRHRCIFFLRVSLISIKVVCEGYFYSPHTMNRIRKELGHHLETPSWNIELLHKSKILPRVSRVASNDSGTI